MPARREAFRTPSPVDFKLPSHNFEPLARRLWPTLEIPSQPVITGCPQWSSREMQNTDRLFQWVPVMAELSTYQAPAFQGTYER
jgi:hypothetical protein